MAIGVDIGTTAVRAAQLEQRRDGSLRLRRYDEVALPPGAMADGEVVDARVVTDALRTLWDRAKLRKRTVALGVGSHRVVVRQIDLPELPEAELREAVRFQAADQLPFPAEEALIDHVVVERLVVGDERRTVRVLLIAAEQRTVDALLDVAVAAKLRPTLIDLEAFALIRSLATASALAEHAELIVDLGASTTTIAVHRGSDPLFVRMVRLGGEGATRQLAERLEMDRDESEGAKLDASNAWAAGVSMDPDDQRVQVLREGMERIVAEVRRSLDYFRSQHEGVSVGRALLCGGVSLVPGLADRLEGVLEVPVQWGEPLATTGLAGPRGEASGEVPATQPFMPVAVGLALGLLR